MRPGPESESEGPKSAAARTRIARSVFLSQLLMAGATLLLVAIAAAVNPAMLSSPVYFAGTDCWPSSPTS